MQLKLKIVILLILSFLTNKAYANETIGLRTLFLNNKANICGINLRNFNAKDTNGNKLIDANEESGNFINAVERLDEIKNAGVNVLHVLPITPVGKLKALGTAGSVYAISDFENINHQLVDTKSALTPKEQAKAFIDEAHKRGIYVVIDLPSCGAYDLFINRPDLFVLDESGEPYIPADWSDVRLFNITNDEKFALDLLRDKKILIIHGGGFNWEQPDHFRVVYLPRIEVLKDSVEKLGDFLSYYRQ